MKRDQVTADGIFLRAFDAAIETVYQDLASAGIPEDAIWASFRRATSILAELSSDVEVERKSPRVRQRSKSQAVQLQEPNLI